MNITSLESALYQRELDRITAKITPIVEQLRAVFTDLVGGDRIQIEETKEAEEIQDWIASLPALGVSYHSGYYTYIANPDLKRIPLSLEKLIKAKAIRDHFAAVDSIAEVADVAQAAYHATNS